MISPFGIDHGEISKALIPMPRSSNKLRNANQVSNQMRKVGGQQGSKTIQLRHAKAKAGTKFQNKPFGG